MRKAGIVLLSLAALCIVARSLQLEFFENSGSASANLLWSSADQLKQAIPLSQLYLPSVQPAPSATPSRAARPTATKTHAPATATPTLDPSPPKLLFGIGPEADGAVQTRLAREAQLGMLTSWYNGPGDLAWMSSWHNDLVPQSYGASYALHLIVFSDDAEVPLMTAYGPACGRAYPLSQGFRDDMRQLAQIFAGAASGPPLYVTLFTEFQTYACIDNAWYPSLEVNNYYRALKERYRETLAIFERHAPNARVSLGWGGWQARWSDPSIGGGRAMVPYFADVLMASDFQSFQAMESDTNVEDIRAMVKLLGPYGPVMLAHYKPDNASQSTFEGDLQAMLTDAYLNEVTTTGLFAWSFLDHNNLSASEAIYTFTRSAVDRYGVGPH